MHFTHHEHHVTPPKKKTILKQRAVSQRSAKPRFWIAAWYTSYHGHFRKRSWRVICLRRTTLIRLWKFKEFCIIFWKEECESFRAQHSSITYSTFQTALLPWTLTVILEELGVSKVWWIFRGFRSRKCISENSWAQWSFKAGKATFKAEVCSKLADPQLTMQWIKEVDIAKTTDELMTSRTTTGRTDFNDYDMLDAMIAKLLIHCVHFRKSKCRRTTCAEIRPILSREASCLHDRWTFSCNRSLWSSTSPGYASRMTMSKILKFDAITSEMFTEMIMEGLYKSNLQDSVQLQAREYSKQRAVEHYWIENVSMPSYWSDNEDKKFQHLERNSGKRDSNQESKRERADPESRVGACSQWKAIGQCPKGDSCSFRSRTRIWKQMRRGTKRTMVLSSTWIEGTDWREYVAMKSDHSLSSQDKATICHQNRHGFQCWRQRRAYLHRRRRSNHQGHETPTRMLHVECFFFMFFLVCLVLSRALHATHIHPSNSRVPKKSSPQFFKRRHWLTGIYPPKVQ